MFHLLSFFVCLFCFALNFDVNYSSSLHDLNFDVNYSSSLHDSKMHLCHDSDSLSLLQFKYSFTTINNSGYRQFDCPGAYPKTKSWKEGVDCCKWQGVKCDIISGHVIGLNLSCSFLMGRLESNSSLFQLHALQSINLAYNNLSSSHISPKFSLFPHLEHLNLSSSGFLGQVPFEIAHLRQLKSLDLSRNLYSFTDFSSITLEMSNVNKVIENLTHLEELDLSFVQLNSIFPKSLSNLSSLTSLQLDNSGLRGNLSAHVFDLPHLRVLRLGGNDELHADVSQLNLSSSVEVLDLSQLILPKKLPSSLRQPISLKELYLRFCNLHGFIPNWIWNVTKVIDLMGNTFVGELPKSVNKKELSSLTLIRLYGNMLKGTIPSWLLALPSLKCIDIRRNRFTGPLNQFHFNRSLLSDIYLAQNFITGEIPSSLFVLPFLNNLDLSSNQFIGQLSELPQSLKATQNLEYLDLSNNKIHGGIPRWMQEIGKSQMVYLDLSNNSLNGGLEHLPWEKLVYVDLNSNLLREPISSSICNNSDTLEFLNLSHNKLIGDIPQCLGNISSALTVLDLQSNNLSGIIPVISKGCESLTNLKLNGNQLKGSLPKSLVHCKHMELLDLGNNQLNDTFPYWLGSLPKLQVLVLCANNLFGPIGNRKGNHSFRRLRILDLSNNFFVGTLPNKFLENLKAMKEEVEKKGVLPDMGEIIPGVLYYQDSVTLTFKGFRYPLDGIFTNLAAIDISSNTFEGEVSDTIGNLISLKYLNLSHNNFNHSIPSSLGNLSALESLDLSFNKLVGHIPSDLVDLTSLGFFNVSYNQLNGPIPQGMRFLDSSSYVGNPRLCGIPMSKKCKEGDQEASQQRPSSESAQDEGVSLWEVVMMGYGCGMVGGLSAGYIMFSIGRPLWLMKLVDYLASLSLRLSRKNRARRQQGRRN